MRKYYDGQPDPQPTTTSAGTSEHEPLPVRSESVGCVAAMSESQVIELLKKHGINVMLGERHSVRCQYAQILNVVRELEEQHNDKSGVL